MRKRNSADADYNPGPIVPLDAQPSRVFDRPIKDVVSDVDLISVNVSPGGTKIGDHPFDYKLQEIILKKWSKSVPRANLSMRRCVDLGAEAPLLRHNGSALLEVASLFFCAPSQFSSFLRLTLANYRLRSAIPLFYYDQQKGEIRINDLQPPRRARRERRKSR